MAVLYILNVGIVSYAYYKARQDFWNTSELAGLITRGMKLKIKRQMEKLVSYPIVFLCCCILVFLLVFPPSLFYLLSLQIIFAVNYIYNYDHPDPPVFVLHSVMLMVSSCFIFKFIF
jgi:hypothetical protein